jgi:hypothetical protein
VPDVVADLLEREPGGVSDRDERMSELVQPDRLEQLGLSAFLLGLLGLLLVLSLPAASARLRTAVGVKGSSAVRPKTRSSPSLPVRSLSASSSRRSSAMIGTRRVPFRDFGATGPTASSQDRQTEIRFSARSTSSHLRPRSSPLLQRSARTRTLFEIYRLSVDSDGEPPLDASGVSVSATRQRARDRLASPVGRPEGGRISL